MWVGSLLSVCVTFLSCVERQRLACRKIDQLKFWKVGSTDGWDILKSSFISQQLGFLSQVMQKPSHLQSNLFWNKGQPAHPISPMYIFQIWPKTFPGFDQIPLFGTGFLWSAILVSESIQSPGILFNTRRPLQLEYLIVTISSLQCDAWTIGKTSVCVFFFFFFECIPGSCWNTIFSKMMLPFWKMINSLTPTIDNGWKLGSQPTGLKNGGWTSRGYCYSLSPVIMVLWKNIRDVWKVTRCLERYTHFSPNHEYGREWTCCDLFCSISQTFWFLWLLGTSWKIVKTS